MPSLPVYRVPFDDRFVLFWVVLGLVRSVDMASLLDEIPHLPDVAGEDVCLVLGNASLLEKRMCASGDRIGSRTDASRRFELGCTWQITATCPLSVAAKGLCDIVGVPSARIRVVALVRDEPRPVKRSSDIE